MSRRALVFVFDGCELLDYAGPVQVLHEVGPHGGESFEILYCGEAEQVTTAQGMVVANVCGLPAHWRRTRELQRRHPTATVLGDRLYVEDGPIITSPGIAAGIDMTLWLLERDYGPVLAGEVAREMVVYLRRAGHHAQESVYLDYQTHLNPGVHQVQHFLASEPGSTASVAELARRFGMSDRNLSRAFRKATGMTVHRYRTRVRLAHARALLRNPGLTMDAIAEQCGFASAGQLRRLLNTR